MMDKSKDYIDGWNSAEQYFNSKCFVGFTRDITGEQVIKIFKPPVTESLMMVSSPIPKDRCDWIEGFNDWMKEESKSVHPSGCLCENCLFDKEGD